MDQLANRLLSGTQAPLPAVFNYFFLDKYSGSDLCRLCKLHKVQKEVYRSLPTVVRRSKASVMSVGEGPGRILSVNKDVVRGDCAEGPRESSKWFLSRAFHSSLLESRKPTSRNSNGKFTPPKASVPFKKGSLLDG